MVRMHLVHVVAIVVQMMGLCRTHLLVEMSAQWRWRMKKQGREVDVVVVAGWKLVAGRLASVFAVVHTDCTTLWEVVRGQCSRHRALRDAAWLRLVCASLGDRARASQWLSDSTAQRLSAKLDMSAMEGDGDRGVGAWARQGEVVPAQ